MTETNEIDRVRVGQDEILFRRLDAPVASWSKPGGRWAVEYWARGMGYPLAQAWVSEAYDGYIDRLHVAEEFRRQGIGTELLKAIQARWPGVGFDAFSELAEQFLAGCGVTARSDEDDQPDQ